MPIVAPVAARYASPRRRPSSSWSPCRSEQPTSPTVGANAAARSAAGERSTIVAMPSSTPCSTAGPPRGAGTALGQGGLELGFEALLGHGADDLLRDLAVTEQDQRRDRQHLELRRRLRVVVDVQLDDLEVRAFAGDLLEHG